MKMKRNISILVGILSASLVSGCISGQNTSDLESSVCKGIRVEKAVPDEPLLDERMSGEIPAETLPKEETEPWGDEKPIYVDAYTKFLLYANMDPDSVFPIRGYYLMDLNFDDIPELGILHDSWGSMGGYFTYYYFDGNEIRMILDERGEQARVSNYTQVLADFEQKKLYLLKEMYLLQGNSNGTYGYVREIKSQGQVPYVCDILNLEVDQESDLMSHFGHQYKSEDEFLSDPELDACLITQYYFEKEWIDISSEEYLKRKRELIPEENSLVDLRLLDLNYLGVNYNGEGLHTDVKIEKEEIDELFRRFEQWKTLGIANGKYKIPDGIDVP